MVSQFKEANRFYHQPVLALRRLKIGCFNTHGWIAYQRDKTLFVRRFAANPTARYPVLGCKIEVHLDERHVELETLGPIRTLEPQAGLEPVER